MKKNCVICGKEYEAIKRNQKYCSKTCKNKAQVKKNRIWRNNNRERYRELQRNRHSQKQIEMCRIKHNNCFNCPTKNGECLYE